MGTVSHQQGGADCIYLAGFARQYSGFHPHHDGKTHEVNVLDTLSFEAGVFYVMDRGYLDFSRLFTL
jgi:hypothetical protein